MLCEKEGQKAVDQWIKNREQTVQTGRTGRTRSDGTQEEETEYTKARNDLAHYHDRPGAGTYDEACAQAERLVRPFQAILASALRSPTP